MNWKHNLKRFGRWVFWKYVGVLFTFASLPAWPWVIFQFIDNTKKGYSFFLLDWTRQPEPHNHKQILMHSLAMEFKNIFEFAMECIEK